MKSCFLSAVCVFTFSIGCANASLIGDEISGCMAAWVAPSETDECADSNNFSPALATVAVPGIEFTTGSIVESSVDFSSGSFELSYTNTQDTFEVYIPVTIWEFDELDWIDAPDGEIQSVELLPGNTLPIGSISFGPHSITILTHRIILPDKIASIKAKFIIVTTHQTPLTSDSNGDGILDVDAIALGLDPNDPDGDTDNDGLTDVDEVGDITAPMDNDGDGVLDALEPGTDASSAEIASGLLLVSGNTVTITTEPGEMLSQVSATEATDSPVGIKFPYGMVSYITTAPIGGSVTVRITFSANLPDNLVIEKVDSANNYTPLPNTVWNQVDDRSVDITLTDGEPLTDMDGAADGSIEDPVAVGSNTGGGGSGGCTIGPNSNVDPVWLFILLASGVGYLRLRRLSFMEVSAKKVA